MEDHPASIPLGKKQKRFHGLLSFSMCRRIGRGGGMMSESVYLNDFS